MSDAAPEKVALAACDEKGNVEWEINYGQLKDKIRKCASWLADLGVRDGDVLGLGIPNSVELLLLSWTAWGMGAITVPLDLKRDRMEQHVYKLESANAKILVAKKGVFSRQQTSGLRIKSVEIEDLKPVSSRDSAKVKWKKGLSSSGTDSVYVRNDCQPERSSPESGKSDGKCRCDKGVV